jgi:hypothetical protein
VSNSFVLSHFPREFMAFIDGRLSTKEGCEIRTTISRQLVHQSEASDNSLRASTAIFGGIFCGRRSVFESLQDERAAE